MTETKTVSSVVAARNDALRARIPAVSKPDLLLVTCGVMALGDDAVAAVLERVKAFNQFTPDNDPWG